MPGTESFRRAITEFRNMSIVLGIAPLITFRQQLHLNDELGAQGGTDTPTKNSLRNQLLHCDHWRRLVTHNPDGIPLGDQIAKAIDPEGTAVIGDTPFGGDDIQMASGGLIDLPFALDGSDLDIPPQSAFALGAAPGGLLLMGIDRAIVAWTRIDSRHRTLQITQTDSMRLYGNYQQLLGIIETMFGDANKIDIPQGVLPSQEPLGPGDSPNQTTETSGNSAT
jgi:hypothetical protein